MRLDRDGPGPARMCPGCRRPLGPPSGDHAGCGPTLASLNGWPDGARDLRCLACDRPFRSDSKAQRLCRACRGSGHRPR